MIGISLNYEKKTGKLDITIGMSSYNFNNVKDSEVVDYLNYAMDFHDTGLSPGEAGMRYDSIKDKDSLISLFMEQQAESEREDAKVKSLLERMDRAIERIFTDPEEIEERERFARRLGRMTLEDYFRPIGSNSCQKRAEYNKIMEMKKEFDEPIPDEIIYEIDDFSRIPHMKTEDWFKTFI